MKTKISLVFGLLCFLTSQSFANPEIQIQEELIPQGNEQTPEYPAHAEEFGTSDPLDVGAAYLFKDKLGNTCFVKINSIQNESAIGYARCPKHYTYSNYFKIHLDSNTPRKRLYQNFKSGDLPYLVGNMVRHSKEGNQLSYTLRIQYFTDDGYFVLGRGISPSSYANGLCESSYAIVSPAQTDLIVPEFPRVGKNVSISVNQARVKAKVVKVDQGERRVVVEASNQLNGKGTVQYSVPLKGVFWDEKSFFKGDFNQLSFRTIEWNLMPKSALPHEVKNVDGDPDM